MTNEISPARRDTTRTDHHDVGIKVQWKRTQLELDPERDLGRLRDKLHELTGVRPAHQRLVAEGGLMVSNDDQLSQAIATSRSLLLIGSSAGAIDGVQDAERRAAAEDVVRRERRTISVAALNNARRGRAAALDALGGEHYGFGRTEALAGFSDRDEAQRILDGLASDRHILRAMRQRRWHVGVLAEMAPDGLVGVDPVCVLGLNVNKGQRIQLRLRTDDLKGFRKARTIRETLYHELAHNEHSDHDANFYALMREIAAEADADAQVWEAEERVHRLGGAAVVGDGGYEGTSNAAQVGGSGARLGGGDSGKGGRIVADGSRGGSDTAAAAAAAAAMARAGAGKSLTHAGATCACRAPAAEPEQEQEQEEEKVEHMEEQETEEQEQEQEEEEEERIECTEKKATLRCEENEDDDAAALAAAIALSLGGEDAGIAVAAGAGARAGAGAGAGASAGANTSTGAATIVQSSCQAPLPRQEPNTTARTPPVFPAPLVFDAGSRQAQIQAAVQELSRECESSSGDLSGSGKGAGERALETLDTLIAMLQTAMLNPGVERFRRFRLANKRFQRLVGSRPPALQLLHALGFEHEPALSGAHAITGTGAGAGAGAHASTGGVLVLRTTREDTGLMWLAKDLLQAHRTALAATD